MYQVQIDITHQGTTHTWTVEDWTFQDWMVFDEEMSELRGYVEKVDKLVDSDGPLYKQIYDATLAVDETGDHKELNLACNEHEDLHVCIQKVEQISYEGEDE